MNAATLAALPTGTVLVTRGGALVRLIACVPDATEDQRIVGLHLEWREILTFSNEGIFLQKPSTLDIVSIQQ